MASKFNERMEINNGILAEDTFITLLFNGMVSQLGCVDPAGVIHSKQTVEKGSTLRLTSKG